MQSQSQSAARLMLPGPAAGALQAAGIGAAPRGKDCAGLLAGSSGSLRPAPSGDAPRAAVYGEGYGTLRLQSALHSWIPLGSAPARTSSAELRLIINPQALSRCKN